MEYILFNFSNSFKVVGDNDRDVLVKIAKWFPNFLVLMIFLTTN